MVLTALFLRRAGAVLTLIVLASNLAFGQAGSSTADLSGLATDPQGSVVPGVAVTLRNVETNIERTATSNDEGAY